MPGDWNPDQYHRFRDERSRPFFDLMECVGEGRGRTCLDLGCGTGELTAELHREKSFELTLGIDRSPAMLGRAREHEEAGLRFEAGDIATYEPRSTVDVVFSNAALHWVDDHPALLTRLRTWLHPGGEIAVQVPANHDTATHEVANEVAGEEPFRSELKGHVRESPVLKPDEYARLLHRLGFRQPTVRLEVYPHVLDRRDDVIEWVRGTLLTAYQVRLSGPTYERFLERYQERLFEVLPDEEPFFYPFKRILMWGKLIQGTTTVHTVRGEIEDDGPGRS
ncbi:MAG: methyltransferase domain-containing protein [Planctomycetota bacterium]